MRTSFGKDRTRESPIDESDPLAFFDAEPETPISDGVPTAPKVVAHAKPRTPKAVPIAAVPASVPKSISTEATPSARTPEHVTPAAQPAPTPAPAPKTLSIQAVLDVRPPVHWLEAVAIIERAAAALLNGDVELPAPGPSGIFVGADGSVAVESGTPDDRSVNRLGRALHDLTSTGPMPAPLRLLVTKWIETNEAYPLRQFWNEVGHYARPDGDALIRSVYERCCAASATRPALRTAPPVQHRALATTAAAIPERQPPSEPLALDRLDAPRLPARIGLPHVTAPRAAMVAGFGIGTLAAAGIILGGLLSPAVRPPLPDGTLGPIPFGDSMVFPGAPPFVVVQPGPLLPPLAAERRTRTVTAALPPLAQPAAASAPSVPASPVAVAVPPAPVVAAAVIPPAASVPTSIPTQPSNRPGRIHSIADAGVIPPLMFYPQARPARSGDTTADYNTMELLVSERGTVEQVRLLTSPKRMTDMMLLAGAKTWRFEPATLNGTTVRYRLVMTWPTTR